MYYKFNTPFGEHIWRLETWREHQEFLPSKLKTMNDERSELIQKIIKKGDFCRIALVDHIGVEKIAVQIIFMTHDDYIVGKLQHDPPQTDGFYRFNLRKDDTITFKIEHVISHFSPGLW